MSACRRVCAIAMVVLLAMVAGCAAGAPDNESPSLATALHAALQRSFERTGAPGAVAAVKTPDITWIRSVGFADTVSHAPMANTMHTRIGGVTETFTVTLVLQAAADGLLSLDDTIDNYYSGIPDGDQITLRQLADHRSGIADYTENEEFVTQWTSDPERVWGPYELVEYGLEQSPLFPPGTDFHYSNTDTVLLAICLRQVTGKAVGQLYKERILDPLSLRETSFPDDGVAIPQPHPRGYSLFGQPGPQLVDTTDWNPSVAWAAGAMISTAEDLLTYGRALGTGEGLLSPNGQTERRNSMQTNPKEPGTRYGLGLMESREWIGHAGHVPGFAATLFYHPRLQATVVVLANSDVASGECPPGVPTLNDNIRDHPCSDPASLINVALAEVLGQPFGG